MSSNQDRSLLNLRAEASIRAGKLRGRLVLDVGVPPEILAMIFIYCAGDQWIEIPHKQGTSAAIVISQVCSRWRYIAFAEPLLWGKISVAKVGKKLVSPLLHAILSNCGGKAAIALRIVMFDCEDWAQLQRLVSAFPSRLRRIELYRGLPPDLDIIIELSELAEVIHLRVFSVKMSCWPIIGLRIPEDCTNLQVIEVIGEHHISLPQVVCPRAQLTRLQLLLTSLSALSDILRQCPRLVSLKIGLRMSEQESQSCTPQPIPLVRLRSVYIYKSQGIGHFLNLLVVPALNELNFESADHWPQTEIIDLIERSACPVDSFRIVRGVVPAECILPLMRAMPHVRTLKFQPDGQVPTSVFNTMVEEGLAPRLKFLSSWFIHAKSLEAVVAFLQSRWSISALGRYEGLREAHFPITSQYSRNELPDLNNGGRRVYFIRPQNWKR